MFTFETGFYKRLFESLDNNSVLMRVEEDGTYYPIWCSREFTEMMEGTEEDFIRLESGGTMSTIHPDDQEKVAFLFRHHKTKDGTNSLTIRKYTVQNHEIWVNVHYAFVEEKEVQYAYCTYTDVTEIKRSEEQTKSMYEGVRSDLESLSHDALTFLRVNLTKNLLEEVRGKDTYEADDSRYGNYVVERRQTFPLPSDAERFAKTFSRESLLQAFRSGNQTITDVLFTRRQNGRLCFANCSATLREDPISGDIISFYTEWDYNDEMVNQTILHKALVEQYDMITYLVGGEYGVVIGDAARITKGSIFPKERQGNYADYIQNQVVPFLVGTEEEKTAMAETLSPERVARELSEKEPYRVDVACEIDGEVFYKRFVYYVVNGEAEFYILLKSDVTDLVREQQQRNELLTNALHEAEQANAAKTSFLSSMSHEIRTPMNAIIGLDSIALKEPDLSPRTREHLEKIGGSAKHLLNLINDILDMSRIESGRMTIRNEEFSFREMLEQINTMVGGQCQDKGLTYDCHIKGKVSDFYIGDDMKLKQVIINILGNAVKFTPEGGTVTFIVEPISQFEDKVTIRFIMQDTGIGMDKAYLPKIFDAFSQENENKANKYGSTGLGMAITKNIVEMMNGNISVDSEKGVGSTFTVTVTLKQSDKQAQDTEDLRPQDMRVLVIDDDPVACEHAKLVLEEVGIASEFCYNGKEALEMLRLAHARREAYDLILVDLKMPDQDGMEVTKAIRDLYNGESTIIILTAYNWDDIFEDAMSAGVDSFMAKPLFASRVLEEFKQAITRKNATHEAEHRADLNGKHILLAEDMIINAEIMRELLKMRNMEVDHAENGKICVDMFEASAEHYYDAILMDVRMPVMTGLEATAAIRALDRPDAKSIPIIAMTANAFDEDVQRSLQVGMNAHLSKPVEPEHLYDTLEILIEE